jgi:hypothetical protein
MTSAEFAAKLRAEGVTVVEVGNWEHHNRNHKGPWGPVYGVMIHHTVTRGDTKAQTDASVALCRDGHSALPGPLCHGVIAKDGTVYLVGYGRTNHAGMGDDDVQQAVINETALPVDDEANTDGNRSFYGFECINLGDGQDPWPEAQLEAIERVSAAICRHHGWGARSVIGHLEWQPGKVDPRGFSMQTMRGRVAARLDGNQEDDVALTDAEIEKIARKVLTLDGVIVNPVAGSENTHLALASSANRIETVVRRTEAKVIGLAAPTVSDAQIAALASAVAANPALAEQIAEKVAVKLAERLAE